MFNPQGARINTAGAYVIINGLYLFTIGIKLHNGHIPVVRLGGHREENETGWQCAVREVLEEANLRIEPILPQTTYLCDWDNLDAELSIIPWQHNNAQEPIPCLVVTYSREEVITVSLMYFARATGVPMPSSEVKGLLLLDEAEIHRICQGPTTLAQYLNNGGKAILSDEFNTCLMLEPFAQLRLLSKILSVQSETNAA